LLEWVLCEILGALPLREDHIEEDNRKLFSMPVGARPSIEEIRTVNSTWYSSAAKNMRRVGWDWGFSIASYWDLIASELTYMTQAWPNTFWARIALPTGLKCAHQHYPERRRTPGEKVYNRLNATALQIAPQKMAFWDWFSSDKSYSQRTKIAAGVTQDRNLVLSETTRPRY
jgi:hypothetical protein